MNTAPNIRVLGQGLMLIVMGVFFVMLITTQRPWLPLLDNANLIIHESGHVFFATLGEFMGFLGGSLMQLLAPLACALYFKYSNQIFSFSFAIFWLGDSLINLSVYIKDARAMLLPLINDGIHDWNWILTKIHLLTADQILGNITYLLGFLCALVGLGLCGYIFLNNSKQLFKSNIGA